jgi:hypothetical protein
MKKIKRPTYKRELENQMPSEISAVERDDTLWYKKGGLVKQGKPKLAKKGWR